MYVEMIDPQRVLLEEIADQRMKRDDVALSYAFAIRQQWMSVDFAMVNEAIINRWSLNALSYIKDRAWRLVEGQA